MQDLFESIADFLIICCIGSANVMRWDAPPHLQSNFVHFHAIFATYLPNNRLAPNASGAHRPMWKNPGSTTVSPGMGNLNSLAKY